MKGRNFRSDPDEKFGEFEEEEDHQEGMNCVSGDVRKTYLNKWFVRDL